MGKSEPLDKIVSERIASGGQKITNSGSKEHFPVMGQVIDEVIYILDDENKKKQFRVEDEFEEFMEEFESQEHHRIYNRQNKNPLCISPINRKSDSDSDEKYSEDESSSDQVKSNQYVTDKEKDVSNNSEDVVEGDHKSNDLKNVVKNSIREDITNKEGDISDVENNTKKVYTLLSNDVLHFSLKKAFYPGIVANNHMWMLMDCQPAYEEEDVDVMDDLEIRETLPFESIQIDDDVEDELITGLKMYDGRHRNQAYESKEFVKSSNNLRTSSMINHSTEIKSLEKRSPELPVKQNDREAKTVQESVSSKSLSWNPQQSSHLEKKSIIIGGVVKQIISANSQSGLAKPMKAVLNKNVVKTLIRPLAGTGNSILKSMDVQVKPIRIVNSQKSLLRPIKPKPSSEASQGTFIKISDIQGESSINVSDQSDNSLTSKSTNQSAVPTIKFVPTPSLSTSQSHLLKSSTRALQSILKSSSSIQSTDAQRSPSTPGFHRLVKVTPLLKSSSAATTSYSCRFCNVLFSKQESLRVHQVSKHLDKLKTSPTSGALRPTLSAGKPVLLSLKNGKTQLKNVFIIPKNSSLTQNQPLSQNQASLVTLADLLELERELADHSGNCSECRGGKFSVSELKHHARIHPHGDDTCEKCVTCFKMYKTFMRHLETHVLGSDSDCEFVSEERLSE